MMRFACELCGKFFHANSSACAHGKIHKKFGPDAMMRTKACIKCGLTKALIEFLVDARMKDGSANTCSSCHNAIISIKEEIKREFPPEDRRVENRRAIDAHVNAIRVENSLPIIEREEVDEAGKVTCPCGSRILKKGMKSHLMSFKHKAFIQSQHRVTCQDIQT